MALPPFLGWSCLIVGHGSSIKDVEMRKSYDVDVVIGVHDALHYDTEYVCSRDTNTFWQYEEYVYRYKPHIKLVLHPLVTQWQPPASKRVIYWHDDCEFDDANSGAFAIGWAVASGFKRIYTAGIDYWAPQQKYEEIDRTTDANVFPWVACRVPADVEIFKWADYSRLLCDVRQPRELSFEEGVQRRGRRHARCRWTTPFEVHAQVPESRRTVNLLDVVKPLDKEIVESLRARGYTGPDCADTD